MPSWDRFEIAHIDADRGLVAEDQDDHLDLALGLVHLDDCATKPASGPSTPRTRCPLRG
jgi:hypothetical protein